MKAILAVLLCYLLFASESFALKEGPPYPTPGTVASTGQFAGALTPKADSPDRVNSIGIFSVLFSPTGVGSGTLIIFQTGQTYTGTMQGVYNTQNSTIAALLDATFPYTKLVPTFDPDTGNRTGFEPQDAVAVASGSLTADVIKRMRIVGESTVDFSLTVNHVDSRVNYDVTGFAQGS